MTAPRVVPCVGCGLVSTPVRGPTHPYMLSSPGCWSLYGELMTSGAGQMAVDAYAVQHPGVSERRARQSVAVHLISLCAAFERDWPPDLAARLISRSIAAIPQGGRPWLAPEPPIGTVTVFDVLMSDSPRLAQPVRNWAEDLWAAYADRHATVRRWLDEVLEVGG